jgi:hypothetical protein
MFHSGWHLLRSAELIDCIIDFLHPDEQALKFKVCSLVRRNWLPASRFISFSVNSFVRLLASPWSTIASHVHLFHIHYTSPVNVPVFDFIAPYLEDFVAVKSFYLLGCQRVPISEKLKALEGLETWISRESFTIFLIAGSISRSRSVIMVLPRFHHVLRALCSAFSRYGSHSSVSWLSMVARLPAVRKLDPFGYS